MIREITSALPAMAAALMRISLIGAILEAIARSLTSALMTTLPDQTRPIADPSRVSDERRCDQSAVMYLSDFSLMPMVVRDRRGRDDVSFISMSPALPLEL